MSLGSQGPKQSVIESYEWTQTLSSGQRMLSSGKMHLIRETGAQAISCRVVRVNKIIMESTTISQPIGKRDEIE